LKINNIIEIHNGSLSYEVTKVIYKDKEFDAPIDVSVLMQWDYIYQLLKNKEDNVDSCSYLKKNKI
jgi:hypothetical protein